MRQKILLNYLLILVVVVVLIIIILLPNCELSEWVSSVNKFIVRVTDFSQAFSFED